MLTWPDAMLINILGMKKGLSLRKRCVQNVENIKLFDKAMFTMHRIVWTSNQDHWNKKHHFKKKKSDEKIAVATNLTIENKPSHKSFVLHLKCQKCFQSPHQWKHPGAFQVRT